MRYTSVESQKFPLSNRITFVDLGYLYGEKGATFIHHDVEGNLGKALKEGAVQTSAPLLDATAIDPEQWSHRQEAERKVKELFPYAGEVMPDYLRSLYVLLGPELNQQTDCLFCCVDPADDVPLLHTARRLGVKCVNVLDEKTLYRIQDFTMDNTLLF